MNLWAFTPLEAWCQPSVKKQVSPNTIPAIHYVMLHDNANPEWRHTISMTQHRLSTAFSFTVHQRNRRNQMSGKLSYALAGNDTAEYGNSDTYLVSGHTCQSLSFVEEEFAHSPCRSPCPPLSLSPGDISISKHNQIMVWQQSIDSHQCCKIVLLEYHRPMTPYTPILGISWNYCGQWEYLELTGVSGGGGSRN